MRGRKAGTEKAGGKRGVEKEAVGGLDGVDEEEMAMIALQEAEEDAEVALAVRCLAAHAHTHIHAHTQSEHVRTIVVAMRRAKAGPHAWCVVLQEQLLASESERRARGEDVEGHALA